MGISIGANHIMILKLIQKFITATHLQEPQQINIQSESVVLIYSNTNWIEISLGLLMTYDDMKGER